MKIQTECVPCLLKRIIFETELSTKNSKLKTKTIKNACNLLSNLYDPNVCSATIATQVHKIVYDTLNDKDPYKKLKKKSNKVAKNLVPSVEDYIKCSDDPLRIAILCSIIGNMMDFGIAGASTEPEDLTEIFEDTFIKDLGYDDTDKLKELIKKSKNVLLFTDNCGEIVFDKILCREIKNFNPNLKLILVVKGEPIISDATFDDAEELNLNEVCDDIITTGCFAIGLDFEKLDKDLEDALKETDLIICKGMANYEAFSEKNYRPIAYLMRTKCSAIANSIGVEKDINVVKLFE